MYKMQCKNKIYIQNIAPLFDIHITRIHFIHSRNIEKNITNLFITLYLHYKMPNIFSIYVVIIIAYERYLWIT